MNLSAVVFKNVETWIREIETLDVEALARSTGFQKRAQRKIDMKDLTLGVMAVAAAGRLSFERVAASIARRACERYSKQALHKRLGASVSHFLLAVFGRCLRPAIREASARGLLAPFPRVLLQDSSTIALPDRYAKPFPGSANQHKSFSQLKLQVVCDLLQSRLAHVSLSGFTRNDQRAAPDILELLRPGDLIIRDLGYFVLSVFSSIIERKAFFLSRYFHTVKVIDPRSSRPIPLAKVLKRQGFFDRQVWLGEDARVPVRLIAVAVPDAVANARRRKLRNNRDQNLHPGKEHFFLLGWNIFVTNVTSDIWPAKQLPVLYRLRWRIETLFKAWKSHLTLTELSDQCLSMIHLSIMTKLIFCAFVYRTCHHLEIIANAPRRHPSILRVSKLLSALSIFFEAAFVKLTPQRLLMQLLDQHAFHEQRRDRHNYYDLLHSTCPPLG